MKGLIKDKENLKKKKLAFCGNLFLLLLFLNLHKPLVFTHHSLHHVRLSPLQPQESVNQKLRS